VVPSWYGGTMCEGNYILLMRAGIGIVRATPALTPQSHIMQWDLLVHVTHTPGDTISLRGHLSTSSWGVISF
jgi:hypothetical protein